VQRNDNPAKGVYHNLSTKKVELTWDNTEEILKLALHRTVFLTLKIFIAAKNIAIYIPKIVHCDILLQYKPTICTISRYFSLALYVYICVCVCVCVYIYIYIYIYIYRQISNRIGNDMERAETFRIITL